MVRFSPGNTTTSTFLPPMALPFVCSFPHSENSRNRCILGSVVLLHSHGRCVGGVLSGHFDITGYVFLVLRTSSLLLHLTLHDHNWPA